MTPTLTGSPVRPMKEVPKEESHGKPVHGVYSPSCGYPVGVFWNSGGCSSLWAHELGHNRHFEHAASAPMMTGAAGQHDNQLNEIATFHADEMAGNKNWDRACLMSYVEQCVSDGTSTGGKRVKTYDEDVDVPCFCFKCVLWNRGWNVIGFPNPDGKLKDL